MKIIALKGDDDCGKSTTLNLVYDSLVNVKSTTSTPKNIIGNPIYDDFECVVTLIDGKSIGFFTMGDLANLTLNAIDRFEQQNVDVLVLAINAKFVRPETKILKFSNIIINKRIAISKSNSIMQTENDKDCNTIISLI
jgi:hypothetical protein